MRKAPGVALLPTVEKTRNSAKNCERTIVLAGLHRYLHEFASVASAAAARLNAEAIDAGAVVGRQRLYLEGARWYRVCTLLDAGTTNSQLHFLKRKNSETSQFHLLLSDVGLYTCTIWLSLYLGSEFTKHLTTNIVFVPF